MKTGYCPNCKNKLYYFENLSSVKCVKCGSTFAPTEVLDSPDAAPAPAPQPEPVVEEQLVVEEAPVMEQPAPQPEPELVTRFCPYCGGRAMIPGYQAEFQCETCGNMVQVPAAMLTPAPEQPVEEVPAEEPVMEEAPVEEPVMEEQPVMEEAPVEPAPAMKQGIPQYVVCPHCSNVLQVIPGQEAVMCTACGAMVRLDNVEEPQGEQPVEEPVVEEALIEEPEPQPVVEEAPVEEPVVEEAPVEEPVVEEQPAAEPEPQPEPVVEEQPVVEGPKFCSQCGARLAPGAKFCSQCGHRII